LRVERIVPAVVMTLGVFSVSTGAIFVRLADAHPIVKSAYRLGFASLIIVPLALLLRRREYAALGGRDFVIGALSGFFLALHFGTWITSLDYTTVASSLVLVNTAPIWVAVFNMASGRGRPSRLMSVCIVLSVIGAAMVGYGDLSFSGEALIGDAFALAGAFAVSAYIICWGELRKKLGLLSYVALCYGTAAVVMWTAALAMGLELSGFSRTTWGALLGMAIMAQVIGHGSYNWALGRFSTGTVSIVLLGEPVGGTVLAYFLFREVPAPVKFAGCALLMLSIVLSSRSGK
jgi:drug/metabolite transporter (DMT)-like permease